MRIALGGLVLVLALAGGALGGRGDPQKRITPADQARATSMLLTSADLPAFSSTPNPRTDDDHYCRATDESDLTVTGEAIGRVFLGRFEAIRSAASIYRTLAEANRAWRRGTSAAGATCLREQAVSEIRGTGVRLVSFGRRTPPRAAQRSSAFRFVFQRPDGLRVVSDIVVLQRSRALAGLIFESAGGPATPELVERLTRRVAARMAKAMRGA